MRKENEKVYNIIAIIFSLIVFVVVGAMREYKFDIGIDLWFLPLFHALLNTCAAIALVIAYRFIRAGEVNKHHNSIIVAMVCSGLFLISYVIYHFTQPQSTYGGEGFFKVVYYIILISHICLAGLSLPFILFTFIRAQIGDYQRHKRMARWVFPIWLYVAITGPLVYLFMLPYY